MWVQTLFLLAVTGLWVPLSGQTTPVGGPLNGLRQDAERKTTEWFTLHKALEDNLSRLLPCDARVRTSIEAVNRASEARMEAWINVTQEWKTLTSGESRNAKRGVADVSAQASSLQAERSQLESQLADLRRRRAALPPAAEAIRPLDELIDLYTQRGSSLAERANQLQGAQQLMADVVAAADARNAAANKEAEQLPTQAMRWRAYYAARISRANIECSITGQSAAPRAPRKKQ